MSNLKIACCMITLDRAAITIDVTRHNINTAGMSVDLFVHDNGSKDWEVLHHDLFHTHCLTHYERTEDNIGVAAAFNSLIKKATDNGYNMIVLMGNDIKNGQGWLKAIHDYATAIPESGLIALDWGCGANTKTPAELHGKPVLLCAGVFGVMGIPPQVLEKVGYFNEAYQGYGIEDSDYNVRVNYAGFKSYYIPGIESEHIVQDAGQNTEYRRMKDESLRKNAQIHEEVTAQYSFYNKVYIGPNGQFEPPINPADIDPTQPSEAAPIKKDKQKTGRKK